MTSPEDKAAQWIRPEIRALSAYHVPDAADLIKLDAMENPYGWPEDMVEDWLERLRGVAINRYPDPSARALRARLGEAFDVPPGMDLLLGNGSDELIQILAMAVAGPGRVVLAPEPSFVMYRMIAQFIGMEYVGVPLAADDFSLDMPAMTAAIERHRPALIFLAYPNNPTGNAFDADAVREIIAMAPGLVVVDEAYTAFAEDSFMPRLVDFPNLLVMRTVSKMGLAGLRLGLLAGAPAWLKELDKLRLPYNINVLTQASAEFALERKAVLDEQTDRIRHDRGLLHAALSELPGLTVYPSQANFILFRTPMGRADQLFQGLRDQGVLIKNLNGAGGVLTDCLRVTVGSAEENAAFLKALRSAL
jgi:histidinol-phosphate aminotransferase